MVSPSPVPINFYPRPPRGGRHATHGRALKRLSISIHALREEGDINVERNQLASIISIHALREEGDNMAKAKAWKAAVISIHALREEGDGSRYREQVQAL